MHTLLILRTTGFVGKRTPLSQFSNNYFSKDKGTIQLLILITSIQNLVLVYEFKILYFLFSSISFFLL